MQMRRKLQRSLKSGFAFKDDAATSGRNYRKKACRIIRRKEKAMLREVLPD